MKPNKVLVVDDSKLIHKMFSVMLREYVLVHANDGYEALVTLGEHADVDLILLDINMPNMNGLEFLNKVKSDRSLEHIPVIIISTEGKEEDTQRAMEGGAAAYVKKPFDHKQLIDTIASL